MSNPAWLSSPSIAAVFNEVAARGGEMRIVGGVVRDLVRGELAPNAWPADIDAATSLPPETMMAIAALLGIKAVPTGIAHGTVTFVLQGCKLEITTLRRDVATDGRHAKVEYTDRFEEDAARRDFTMNALYLAVDGTITDFHGGVADAQAGNVKFIGDPAKRIEEDGLRMLRYFRFLATHGGVPEASALAACKQHLSMIAQLSGERLQQEMVKLLAAKNPQPALEGMHACGVLAEVLQGEVVLPALARLLYLESHYHAVIHPWLRLSVLLAGRDVEALQLVLMRLRVSNEVKQIMTSLAAAVPLKNTDSAAERKEMIRQHGASYFRLLLLRSAALSETPWDLREPLAEATNWQPPQFPVKGGDVVAYGVPKGKAVGEQLKKLEEIWQESDYALNKPDLLKKLKDTLGR